MLWQYCKELRLQCERNLCDNHTSNVSEYKKTTQWVNAYGAVRKNWQFNIAIKKIYCFFFWYSTSSRTFSNYHRGECPVCIWKRNVPRNIDFLISSTLSSMTFLTAMRILRVIGCQIVGTQCVLIQGPETSHTIQVTRNKHLLHQSIC